MSISQLRTALSGLATFLVFLLALYAPVYKDLTGSLLLESHLRPLLGEALAVTEVRRDLIRNFLGHLLAVGLFYSILSWSARKTATRVRVSLEIWRVALLCTGWVLLVSANGLLFPLSNFSVPFDAICRAWVAVLAAGVLISAITLAVSTSTRAMVVSVVVGLGLLSLAPRTIYGESSPTKSAVSPMRNVVLIGVDSLSPQVLHSSRHLLPTVSELMDGALRFDRAYTPLARTYPAWISLLSGQSPAEHGAIFNLRADDRIAREGLLTRPLAAAGYRNVFAIDERRFANIDETYGFNVIVGPKAGVLDFVLQQANDTPLTNLLLQTGLSRFFLPQSRLNVASHANYDAKGFVEEAVAALAVDQPNFLAIHFESAHFPYKSRHAIVDVRTPNEYRARHLSALRVVDDQIRRLINVLRARGHLNDALVIVLSDHGESLGEPETSTTRGGVSIDVSGYGHGFNLASEQQNRVVLGLARFRDGRSVSSPGTVHTQVSLSDVRGAIEHFVATGAVQLTPAKECMFVETGLRLPTARDYRILDERAVATEGMGFYRIDDKGRLRLREAVIHKLVVAKDIGWRCSDRLTYYSSAEGRYFAYRILDEGVRLIEDIATVDDIARIDTYRARLAEMMVP